MDIARDKQIAKVITSSSKSRVVREKRLDRERRVVQCMHISNKEVQHFVSVCWVVNYLTELGGEKKDIIRFIAVKVSKEQESGFRILGF